MAEAPVIRTVGLTKAYGRTLALRDLDLSVEAGEVFGYLGPNGAGKTTTLRLLMGLLRPTSGHAEVLGLDAWRDSVRVHRDVGYLSGEPAFYRRMTGVQHLEYVAHLHGDGDTARGRALSARLDLDLTRQATALSKGNRQKLAVVLALMNKPRLLLLDEPTSGLDPLVQQEFQAMLREHTDAGGSVLLSSHVLGEVQRLADRIGVVRAGRLIAVERLESLRAKSLHHVSATFADRADAAEFSGLPGVRDLHVADGTLTCSAPQSSLDELIKQVSRHAVVDFECAEAELEETFLTYYETSQTPPRSEVGHVA
ncbi:ABC transporter ATP-binding protein [Angustibacter sp. Root456]|uniref:ABC transporter ATP-binding protein n=1 Tax=Angustibacter sp. Root456 TaxID=1736539 RepID=UPI0006F2BBD3|nr:ABC transporter ATP-binding protein [Angustibacter sp. Root456]KQX63678.1 ABC transporter [Angustibacter sp. Root456]